jgi:DNA-binding NtrC family response regulator
MVIEDNESMRLGMSETLKREGYLVVDFADPQQALGYYSSTPVQVVLTDLRMEGLSGTDVLKQIKSMNPLCEVIIVSAYGTVETAVEAMHLGAADFLTKPFSNDELRVRIRKIFEQIDQKNKLEKLELHNRYLNEEIFGDFPEIIGRSKAMLEVFNLIDRIAPGESTILIEGESGTGKELIAHAIHKKSNRSENPFVRVNCGALNDNLLESELFGHEKGAFTGAIKQRRGRFELAENGTLFLDEIGDISTAMQVKLLRVLQEKEYERVGGEETIKCNVRVIAATNKDIQQQVKNNMFREDLYYRLSVIPLKLPALRERKEDIAPLIHFFLKKMNKKKIPQITDGAINALTQYTWPGNIRELENLIERVCVISGNQDISLESVAHYLGNSGFSMTTNFNNLPLDDALFNFEKSMIQHALKKADGVKNRAARLLGIKTSALYYKLEKYGLI